MNETILSVDLFIFMFLGIESSLAWQLSPKGNHVGFQEFLIFSLRLFNFLLFTVLSFLLFFLG